MDVHIVGRSKSEMDIVSIITLLLIPISAYASVLYMYLDRRIICELKISILAISIIFSILSIIQYVGSYNVYVAALMIIYSIITISMFYWVGRGAYYDKWNEIHKECLENIQKEVSVDNGKDVRLDSLSRHERIKIYERIYRKYVAMIVLVNVILLYLILIL